MHDSAPSTLSEDIRELLVLREGEDLTLGELSAAVGKRGFGILLILLSLPSALPFPAPGYSTPFGIILFLLSLQILAGRRTPWLPSWARRRVIKRSTADGMISGGAKFFAYLEKFIRPRYTSLTGRTGTRFCALLLLVMSGLMILPIPLTNTLPAMVIFCVGVALTERDGLALGAALLFGAGAILLYSLAFYVIARYGARGMIEAKEIIKGWFR
ncbi:MAG: exopolysaccharide biosynthesis protein [Synergistaceae bacterium]|nr:exopolysaccharide biosynthesis protein [Synergistaceae bacterium]